MIDQRAIADLLLRIGAVSLRPQEPYTWTSGIQSPIYCDNRLTLSSVVARKLLIDQFIEMIARDFPHVECVAGTATAGIPHAAWIADRLGLPMVYVRGSAKGHGKQNQVEGRIVNGERVLVVEDTISTGQSALGAVDALGHLGAQVIGVVAIFNYGFSASAQAFADKNLPLSTLTDFATLIHSAVQQQLVGLKDVEILEQFAQNPYGR